MSADDSCTSPISLVINAQLKQTRVNIYVHTEPLTVIYSRKLSSNDVMDVSGFPENTQNHYDTALSVRVTAEVAAL